MAWRLTGTGSGAADGGAGRSEARPSRGRREAGVSGAWSGRLFDPDVPSDIGMGGREADDGAISVTDALNFAKGALEARPMLVEGEVSQCNDNPAYKAVYFSLSDGASTMSCMMFRAQYLSSGIRLEKGQRVRVSGRLSVYPPKGTMQFKARTLEPAGEGDLRVRVARIAERLRREGLMDEARRRPIPQFCQRVALVTSPAGKAVHDVLRTIQRRNPAVAVLFCGVTVEGATAAQSMLRGLEVAQQACPDAILLVRGGGSYEDLMPFNDESLARAVATSRVPVITGIGHEPDTTICDLVSDRRCSTPTAAAESVAPARDEMLAALDARARDLGRVMGAGLERRGSRLALLADRPVMRNPCQFVEQRRQLLDMACDRLVRAIPDMVRHRRADNAAAAGRLSVVGASMLRGRCSDMSHTADRLRSAGPALLREPSSRLAREAGKLEALSPLAVIARGYAMALDPEGHVVSSVSQATEGDAVDVRVRDGVLGCVVRSVTSDDPAEAPSSRDPSTAER
jgi:exodeoxyribonuclease VII large subunit